MTDARSLTNDSGDGKISLAVGARLTVGQRSLEPSVGVRIPGPQQFKKPKPPAVVSVFDNSFLGDVRKIIDVSQNKPLPNF